MAMGACDLCMLGGATRRVGMDKTYWVCATCTQKFQIRQTQEMRHKETVENAQAGAEDDA